MADAPITFRIFLSSPGDVAEERAKACDLLLGLARRPFLRDKVHIDVVTWDDPFAPAPMDGRYSPQQAVDRGLPTPDQCDLTIVLLWSRMGTPLEEKMADGTAYRSGTEWEFEKALGANRPVLVYRRTEKVLLDPDAEDFQARVEQRQRLNEFFDGFKGLGGTLKRSFTPYGSPHELLGRVERDIEHYLHRALEQVAAQNRANTDTDSRAGTAAPGGQVATPTRSAPPPPEVPAAYRAWVVRMHGGIDLLGLRLRKARPPSLASIYVPQTTVQKVPLYPLHERSPHLPSRLDGEPDGRVGEVERRTLALARLAKESLFVSGAPGTGKSTFCRRVACLVAEGAPADQGSMSQEFTEELGDELKGRLPLLLKLRELTDYLPSKRSFTPSDVLDAIERWVTSREPDGLHPALVRAHLDSGSALVILDGMDEVPVSQTSSSLTWHPRAQLIDVLGELTSRWTTSGNRLLVTSRPYGLSAEEARRLQLVAAPLQPLPDTLQRELATRWFAALAQDPTTEAVTAADLFSNIEAQAWLVELAANPLLLTAMCIVFDEGKRLPQDKHELYDRVVGTVLYSRYQDPAAIERVKRELGVIAYGMHTGEDVDPGRATPRPEATFHEVETWLGAYQKKQAEHYVQARTSPFETRDGLLSNSGLFLSTGDSRAGFAHFSFQDFFAAQRAHGVEEGRLSEFFTERAHAPEWRNALSFLFGRVAGVFTEPTKAIELLESCLKDATVDQPGLLLALWDAVAVLTGKKIDLKPETLGKLRRLLIGSLNGGAPIAVRAEAASALGHIGDPRFHDARLWYLPNDEMLGFIEIPAGPFIMGSDPAKDSDAVDDERPQHMVELPTYFIGRFPVTVAQFKAFVSDTGLAVGDADCLRGVPNHPVTRVSWHEALAYCDWLTKKLRDSDGISEPLREALAKGMVMTLPSEAEWEKAARGTDGRIYPWGNEFDESNANWGVGALNGTSAVGLFGPGASPCGALDMAGNVWEWTRSLWGEDFREPSFTYPYTPGDPKRESLQASDEVARVLRGGSFNYNENSLRAAFRCGGTPDARYGDFGFRLGSSRLRP